MSKGLVQLEYRELDVRELVRRIEEEANNLGEDALQIYSRAVSWRPPVAPEAAAAGRAAPKAG